MAKRVTIAFPNDKPYEFYASHVFWCAEPLRGEIVNAGLGTLNDVDRAREVIWIDLARKDNLGKVKTVVRKTLARHSLTDEAVVSIK
jgi:hypothetical protein